MALGGFSTATGNGSLALTGSVANGDNSLAWNGAANGEGSIAFMNGVANGAYSVIIGQGSTTDASATNSFVIGDNSDGNGIGSYVFGDNSIASGASSFAVGTNLSSTGSGSMALGGFSTATGNGSLALTGSVANGDNSLAWNGAANGEGSIAFMNGVANGAYSVIIGQGSTTDASATNSFVIGDNSDGNGIGSYVFGDNSIASGASSFAVGTNLSSTGSGSMALGGFSTAAGNNALALTGSVANGDNSLAWNGTTNGEGSMAFMNGEANGNYSTTIGVNAITAYGAINAIAMGSDTEALGSYAIAIGHDVNAYSFSETVFGFNEEGYIPASTTASNANDRLFVVANGGAAVGIPSSNNAFTILKDGRTGIMRIPTTNILEVNGNASKTAAGDWLANSDKRLKKNINTFRAEDALQKLLQMRGVTYEWDDNQTGNNRPEGQQYGFIAQELQAVFPENVSMDNQGFYQTAYGTYDALYVQSIKALNSKIETLEQENKELKAKLDELYEMVKARFAEE